MMALVVGVVAMVSLRGFVIGLRRVMFDIVVEGRTAPLQVHKKGYLENVLSAPLTLDFEDSEALRAKILAVPGVKAISPRIDFGGMITTPDKKPPPEDGSELAPEDRGKNSFFIVTAFDPALEPKVTPQRFEWISRGRWFPSSDASAVVLNADFAKGLDVSVQPPDAPLPDVTQQSALLAPDRDASLNGENVVIAGTAVLGSPGDKRIGFAPLKTAQRLLRMEGRVLEYGIAINRMDDLHQVRDAVAAAIGPEYAVSTFEELVPFIVEMVGTQDFFFGIITNVFLFVALLGIVNAMAMSVMERVREIGTMLAVGMRRRKIAQLFLIEGSLLGLIGGLLGVTIGSAITWWLAQKGIPLNPPGTTVDSVVRPVIVPSFLAISVAEAAIGAALASIFPALRAARLRPVEALASA